MAHTLYKPVIGQTVFFTDKQRVSIHEAGHSVVYLAVGENVKWTKIWKKTSGWTGETKSLHSDTSFAYPETGKTDVLLRKLMAIFAGYYAVYVLLGYDSAKKARGDIINSQLYADEWFEGEELEGFYDRAMVESYNCVQENQEAIQRIAKCLETKEYLDGEEIKRLFNNE